MPTPYTIAETYAAVFLWAGAVESSSGYRPDVYRHDLPALNNLNHNTYMAVTEAQRVPFGSNVTTWEVTFNIQHVYGEAANPRLVDWRTTEQGQYAQMEQWLLPSYWTTGVTEIADQPLPVVTIESPLERVGSYSRFAIDLEFRIGFQP